MSQPRLYRLDEDGLSLLHYACLCQHFPLAKKLLESRANPDLCSTDGQTPLLMAASAGALAVVEVRACMMSSSPVSRLGTQSLNFDKLSFAFFFFFVQGFVGAWRGCISDGCEGRCVASPSRSRQWLQRNRRCDSKEWKLWSGGVPHSCSVPPDHVFQSS